MRKRVVGATLVVARRAATRASPTTHFFTPSDPVGYGMSPLKVLAVRPADPTVYSTNF
jgi:hypothetical protein